MRSFLKTTPLKKTLTACIFCGLLFVLLLALLLVRDQDFSDTEKRVLSSFPEVKLSAVADGTFESKLETYIQDQMPLRNTWVGLSALFNYATGQNGTDGFYVAKDQYLINTPCKENERNLNSNLRYLNAFAENMGLPSYMLVVPETGYVLDNLLPAKHKAYRDDIWFDKIQEQTKECYRWVDVRDDFLAGKDSTQIYYRTDHHWTSDGALLGANAFLKACGRPALQKSDFEVERCPGFYGTIHSKAALWNKPADTMELWHIPHGNVTTTVQDLGKPEAVTQKDVFFREHLEKYDMYPTYLNGNHSFTHIVNPDAPEGVLLILKDSFGNTLATELTASFREIIMVDLRYYRTQAVSDLVKEYKVDTILVNYSLDSLMNDTNILWLK